MNKVALVTGASSGIGRAIVLALTAEGYTVYAAARRTERMEDLRDKGVRTVRMDVTSKEDVKNGVDKIIKENGRIDVLVNNAGFGSHGAVEDVSIQDAREQLEVNVLGMVRASQQVLPHMREKGAGRIVNISSIAGRTFSPMGGWYYASKHAVEALSDCMRVETKPFGIDVIVIQPGLIQTGFTDIALDNLMRRSGDGPYRHAAALVRDFYRSVYRYASGPEAVAKKVAKALRKKRPAARYPVGRMARLMLWARKWLPDRFFDRLYVGRMKKAKKAYQ